MPLLADRVVTGAAWADPYALPAAPACRLFVGGHASRIQGEVQDLGGDRCFTAAHPAQVLPAPVATRMTQTILDSGAFSDAPAARLTPATALARQLAWERHAARKWSAPGWRADVLVSYDLLIDETWAHGRRTKRRWAATDAVPAIATTVAAAHYLADQRTALAPRTLMLSCQGVTAAQYEGCVQAVLEAATPADWIGLGGWCILGRFTTWLPVFFDTITRCLPRIARAGVGHIHILGVLYRPALGPLVWLADQYGLTVSTDSSAPMLNCTWKDAKKAGVRAAYWRDNVQFWIDACANLRNSVYYRPPEWQKGLEL